jgi:hypothetical protein
MTAGIMQLILMMDLLIQTTTESTLSHQELMLQPVLSMEHVAHTSPSPISESVEELHQISAKESPVMTETSAPLIAATLQLEPAFILQNLAMITDIVLLILAILQLETV